MPLTTADKMALMLAYEPILFFHPNETFAPVRPDSFLEASALWDNSQPWVMKDKDKQQWGENSVGLAFPREPILGPGEISLNPALPNFLGMQGPGGSFPFLESNNMRELFLGHGGWQGELDPPLSLPQFPPAAGVVNQSSVNDLCNMPEIIKNWAYKSQPPGAPLFHYSAEVHDAASLQQSLVEYFLAVGGSPGVAKAMESFQKLEEAIGHNFWMIWYHFFYPAHLEIVPLCEFVALLQEYNLKLPDEATGWQQTWQNLKKMWIDYSALEFGSPGNLVPLFKTLDELGMPFALPLAHYGGDWNSICVIVKPAAPFLKPSEMDSFQKPDFVAYGRRARGLVDQGGIPASVQGMYVVNNPDTVGTHPRVFVAGGTHNNYFPTSVEQPPAAANFPNETVCEFHQVDKDAEPPLDEKNRKKYLATACLAKIGAGIIAGGFLGPILGAIACAAEFLRDFDAEASEALPPSEVPDQPPHENTVGLVLAPASLVAPLFEEITSESADIRPWSGPPEDQLIQDSQIWWPPGIKPSPPGYLGNWGVECTTDPFDRRSGLPFPDFKLPVIEGLLALLSQEE